MPLSLKKYSKISNNVCICYFGTNQKLIERIVNNHPSMQKAFPELNITYAFRSENNALKSITKENLKVHKINFAYIWDLTNTFDVFFDQLKSYFDSKNINMFEDKDQKEHKLS